MFLRPIDHSTVNAFFLFLGFTKMFLKSIAEAERACTMIVTVGRRSISAAPSVYPCCCAVPAIYNRFVLSYQTGNRALAVPHYEHSFSLSSYGYGVWQDPGLSRCITQRRAIRMGVDWKRSAKRGRTPPCGSVRYLRHELGAPSSAQVFSGVG